VDLDELTKLITYIEGAASRDMSLKTRDVWCAEFKEFSFKEIMLAAQTFVRSQQATKRYLHPLPSDILTTHWELKRHAQKEDWPEKALPSKQECKAFIAQMRAALDKPKRSGRVERVHGLGAAKRLRETNTEGALAPEREDLPPVDDRGPDDSGGGWFTLTPGGK